MREIHDSFLDALRWMTLRWPTPASIIDFEKFFYICMNSQLPAVLVMLLLPFTRWAHFMFETGRVASGDSNPPRDRKKGWKNKGRLILEFGSRQGTRGCPLTRLPDEFPFLPEKSPRTPRAPRGPVGLRPKLPQRGADAGQPRRLVLHTERLWKRRATFEMRLIFLERNL